MNPDRLRHCLFPAVPVPFDDAGQPHWPAHEALIGHILVSEIDGVAVWAHTGRGLWLAPDVRATVLTEWRRAIGPDRLLIAAAGPAPDAKSPEQVIQSAREMAKQAADLGADLLMAHPPSRLRDLDDANDWISRYHQAIASAGLPMILFYLYEAAGGVSYAPELLVQLLNMPQVLGIKVATLDSVMTFQDIAALIREKASEKILITGEDRFLGYSAMMGARAALIGMGTACVGLQRRLLDAAWNQQTVAFLQLDPLVEDLARHTFRAPMEGYIQRMLWCLVLQGVIPREAAHDPWGPALASTEFEELNLCLRRIGELSP